MGSKPNAAIRAGDAPLHDIKACDSQLRAGPIHQGAGAGARAGTRAQSRAGRQGARARSQQTARALVRAPSRQGARACQMDVIAKYSSTKMVPKGSSPAARNSTVGCVAQCGGGTWRGIWLVRVG